MSRGLFLLRVRTARTDSADAAARRHAAKARPEFGEVRRAPVELRNIACT